jgi:glycosyltransferase involved in cell wall biosynthesis
MDNSSDAKITIQVVVPSLEAGGTELHILRVYSALVSRGHDVSIVILQGCGSLELEARRAGICVLSRDLSASPPSWLPAIAQEVLHLYRNLSREANTVVCLYLPRAYLQGGLLHFLLCLKSKVVGFRRSLNHYQIKRPFVALLERQLHRYVHTIVGNSASVIEQLVTSEGVDAAKVRLIYNGVDTVKTDYSDSSGEIRDELGIPEDVLLLVKVANLLPYKGHADLLDALSILASEQRSKVHLIMVGRGYEDRSDLRLKATELGLEPHVSWLGSRNDVPELLEAADIGILTSHEEGFSNAILEGMSARLPMVVTDVGGNAEAVIDGETGLVVPSKTPRALAAALEKLILDEELRQSMGEAGRKRVEEHFSLDSCVEAYEALFQESLEQH